MLINDESRVILRRPDGRDRVCRCHGERFAEACVIERGQFLSVMVWGGILNWLKTAVVVVN